MVVNFETQKYVSVRVGTIEIVLKDIKFRKVAAFQPAPVINPFVYTRAAAKANAYFDNVCVMGLLK